MPRLLVTAEDVDVGKPAPDGVLLAAERLGCPALDCLVFEDAAAGIAAAEAAGATLVVITATHTHPLETRHPGVAAYDGLAGRMSPAGRLELLKLA